MAAYFYLGSDPSPVDRSNAPPLRVAVWAAVGAVVAAAATRWLTYTIDHSRNPAARRWPLLVTFLLFAGLTWVVFPAWSEFGRDAAQSGYASSVLGLLGYASLVALGAAGMLFAGQLWAWLRPQDPRGRGVALNASLVCYTSAVTWLVVIAVVHVWPRLAA